MQFVLEGGRTLITLINCFEVAEGREDAFLALWTEVNHYMRKKPGYLRHRLHRAVSPQAPYRFVNIADWESAEQFEAAHDEQFRNLVAKLEWREFRSTPQTLSGGRRVQSNVRHRSNPLKLHAGTLYVLLQIRA